MTIRVFQDNCLEDYNNNLQAEGVQAPFKETSVPTSRVI